MDALTLITIASGVGAIASAVFAGYAIFVTVRSSRTGIVNSNSWATYQMYNSDEIKRGRATARAVAKDPAWRGVTNYGQYQAYFKLDDPEGPSEDNPTRFVHEQEQSLHYLLNYYHQIGMLLQRNLLDRDFTMFLVGEGLADRWDVLGRVPDFYPNYPYNGVFVLYDDFRRWQKHRFPRLILKSGRGRAAKAAAYAEKAAEGAE
jgi:hypothetical protein